MPNLPRLQFAAAVLYGVERGGAAVPSSAAAQIIKVQHSITDGVQPRQETTAVSAVHRCSAVARAAIFTNLQTFLINFTTIRCDN